MIDSVNEHWTVFSAKEVRGWMARASKKDMSVDKPWCGSDNKEPAQCSRSCFRDVGYGPEGLQRK